MTPIKKYIIYAGMCGHRIRSSSISWGDGCQEYNTSEYAYSDMLVEDEDKDYCEVLTTIPLPITKYIL